MTRIRAINCYCPYLCFIFVFNQLQTDFYLYYPYNCSSQCFQWHFIAKFNDRLKDLLFALPTGICPRWPFACGKPLPFASRSAFNLGFLPPSLGAPSKSRLLIFLSTLMSPRTHYLGIFCYSLHSTHGWMTLNISISSSNLFSLVNSTADWPSPLGCESVKSVSRSVVSDPLWPHTL